MWRKALEGLPRMMDGKGGKADQALTMDLRDISKGVAGGVS